MWQKLTLAAAACLPIIGCATSGTTPWQPPAPVVTTQSGQSGFFGAAASDYTLVSINGHRLPYAPSIANDAALPPAIVVSGTLALEANGAFSMSTSYRESLPTGQYVFDNKSTGSCAPEGDAYRMFWDGGGDTQLAIAGDTVTVNNGGMVFRYVKRR